MTVRALRSTRATIALAVLILATIAAVALDRAPHFDIRIVSVAVLVIAAIKIHIVMAEFMEIRLAPPILRLFCAVWLAATTITIVTLYLLA